MFEDVPTDCIHFNEHDDTCFSQNYDKILNDGKCLMLSGGLCLDFNCTKDVLKENGIHSNRRC
jgi:hypothetical protein